ncbi:MerR family DNA-binding protein [Sphingomonas sp. Leaf34]|uniref:MerR family DNA-binding protein n=1 Tax=Sphingomonas sp. Leaf34 TaxID=1736216 RepID=UPI003FA76538
MRASASYVKCRQLASKLDEISELLALDATQDFSRARELAQSRLAALDANIAGMMSARQPLARLAGECGSGSAGPCPILTAFEVP